MANSSRTIADENTAIGDATHPNYNQPSDGVDGTFGMRQFGVECRNRLQQTFTFSMVHDATSAPSVDFGIDPSLLMPAPPITPTSHTRESESSLLPPMTDNHRKKGSHAKRIRILPPSPTPDRPTKRQCLSNNPSTVSKKGSKEPTVELTLTMDPASPIDGVLGLVCRGAEGCDQRIMEDSASVSKHVMCHLRNKYETVHEMSKELMKCIMPECSVVLQVGALKRHLESNQHFADKHLCERCGKGLARKDALKRHQQKCLRLPQ